MPSKEMGERLKRLREAASLSQSQLATRASVPVGSLRNWEYGRREPLLSAASRLARALGVSIDALLPPGADDPEEGSQESGPPAEPRKRGRPRKAASEAKPVAEQQGTAKGAGSRKKKT
jgi:transcriptional regulator with XRE-family HTH domain